MKEDNRIITDQEFIFNVLEENLNDDKDWELYEKWQQLNPIYGNYVQFHCNKCNSNNFVDILKDDKSCPYCDGTKDDIDLVEDKANYKKLCEDDIIQNDEEFYVCEYCHHRYQIREFILNDLKCPECNKNINNKITTEEFNEKEYGLNEEYEYPCENCGIPFVSTLTENIKCPNCGNVYESLDPIDHEDRELDLQINDEDWQNL